MSKVRMWFSTQRRELLQFGLIFKRTCGWEIVEINLKIRIYLPCIPKAEETWKQNQLCPVKIRFVGNTSDFTNFSQYNRSDVKRPEVAALVCDEAAWPTGDYAWKSQVQSCKEIPSGVKKGWNNSCDVVVWMTSAAKMFFHGFLSYCTAFCRVFRLASRAPKYFFCTTNLFSFCSRIPRARTAEGLHFVLQFAQAGPKLFWHVCYS